MILLLFILSIYLLIYQSNCLLIIAKMKNQCEINDEVASATLTCHLPQFSFAKWKDIFLTVIGITSACLSGICVPVLIILYGNLAETFLEYEMFNLNRNSSVLSFRNSNLMNEDGLTNEIIKFSISLTIVGVMQLVFTSFFVGCLNYSALNQCCQVRKIYLQSLMSQKIGHLSQQNPDELAISTIKDINQIENGIGEKLGSFCAISSATLSCLTVSLYHGIKLSAKFTIITPLIVILIGTSKSIITHLKRKETVHLKSAQQIVKNSLKKIKFISAYSKEEEEVKKYLNQLKPVERFNILTGFIFSITGAFLWIIIYSVYSFVFWQGAELIKTDDNYSISSLIIISFSSHIAIFHLFQIPFYFEILRKAGSAAKKILRSINDTLEPESRTIHPENDEKSSAKLVVDATLSSSSTKAPQSSSFFRSSHQELLHYGLIKTCRFPPISQVPCEFNTEPSWKIIFFELLSNNWKKSIYLLLACSASVILGLNLPIYAILFGETVSSTALQTKSDPSNQLKMFTSMFIAAGFVAGCCKIIQISILSSIESKLRTEIRVKVFKSILERPMEWFDGEVWTICDILSALKRPNDVRRRFYRKLVFFTETITSLIFITGLSIYYDWKMGFVSLIFIPLTFVVLKLNKKLIKKRLYYADIIQNDMRKMIIETMRKTKSIGALDLSDDFVDFHKEKLMNDLISHSWIKLQAFLHGVCVSLPTIAYATAIFYAGFVLQSDATTIFKVTEAIVLGTLLVSQLILPLESSTEHSKLIQDLLEQPPDPSNKELNDFQGKITFENVLFAHPFSPVTNPQLIDLNIEIKPGESVAFVGQHSAVSIPIQLLLGFYQPTYGDIIFDDEKHIGDLNLQDLRSQMSSVVDEMFSDESVAFNIKCGCNHEVLAAEIITAARLVLLHDFITSLPNGYFTVLNDIELTAKRRFQVSLARALIRNPKVILIEDLRSCDDDEDTKFVEEIISIASIGRTCLVSTSDPRIAEIFPLLVFINHGNIVGVGSHDELLQENECYHNFCRQNE